MIKSLIRKWWFWVLVVIIAAPVVWFLAGYVPFKYRMWEAESYRDMAKAGYAEMQQEQEALAEAYRKDAYGGKTPEETLRMFVEALEKKDYELASRYFVIERQQEALEENRLGEAGGANKYFLEAYRSGRVISSRSDGTDSYTIEVFPSGENVAFGVRFRVNPFSEKWKILEL